MFAAGIVLFNPDLKRLRENIEAIISQVDKLVLVDNGSLNIKEVELYCQYKKKIHLIKNKKNDGIAKALNQLIYYCYTEQYKWAITLDQDSVSPPNLVENFQKYISLENIAVICPAIKDRNDRFEKQYKNKIEYLEQCITSGAMINTDIWMELGQYDENMFIDMVDFEYCARVRKAGYKIVRVNSVELLHECGKLKIVKIGKRKIQITNHSPLRCYYYAKNIVYCHKKLPDRFSAFWMHKMLFEKVAKVLFWEKDKCNKVKKIVKGVMDSNKY